MCLRFYVCMYNWKFWGGHIPKPPPSRLPQLQNCFSRTFWFCCTLGSTVLKYHPLKDWWTLVNVMAEPRSYHAVAHNNDTIVVTGKLAPLPKFFTNILFIFNFPHEFLCFNRNLQCTFSSPAILALTYRRKRQYMSRFIFLHWDTLRRKLTYSLQSRPLAGWIWKNSFFHRWLLNTEQEERRNGCHKNDVHHEH